MADQNWGPEGAESLEQVETPIQAPEPKAYRLMRADGKVPRLGETASTLGIRVPKDIAPDAEDNVSPDGRHGLSVRPSIDAYMEEASPFVPRRYKEKDPVRFRN